MIEMYRGNSLEILSTFSDNHFSSLVTDPPAAVGLMGKSWDHHKGGREQWIAWLAEIFTEVHRVLKPGAYGVVWALPRTSHWTATALEDAGFEIRDIIHHLFGSGYPTGLNISKAFDREEGKGHRVKVLSGRHTNSTMYSSFNSGEEEGVYDELLPESELAKQWYGWHTKLKPGAEHWILVQKSFDTSVIDNVRTYGVGGLNIEASRVPRTDGYQKAWDVPVNTNIGSEGYLLTMDKHTVDLSENKPSDGFPANIVLSHNADCTPALCVDTCPIKQINDQTGSSKSRRSQRGKSSIHHNGHEKFKQDEGTYWVGESTERGFTDSGGKARFFNQFESNFGYFSRVAPNEKRFYCRGCDQVFVGYKKNYEEHKHHDVVAHPTPKSLRLMEWLITLTTPSGGVVLDPFFGTGSTGVACQNLGFDCVGIDLDEEDGYLKIAESRLGERAA